MEETEPAEFRDSSVKKNSPVNLEVVSCHVVRESVEGPTWPGSEGNL